MATDNLIFQLIKRLEAVYGKKLTDEQMDVYVDLLGEYDFAHVWDAAQMHIKLSVYFPKPAELIKLIADKPRHETEYCKKIAFLQEQMSNYNTSPQWWNRLADEYDKVFSLHAEQCRNRAGYYEVNGF